MAYTLTYSFSNNAYSVTGYTGTPDNVVIPSTYNDGTHGEYSITSIGAGAFSGCSNLVSITLPFVGAKAGITSSSTYQYPLGYIFGTSSYTGGTKVEQYYYGSSTSSATSTSYYIPSTLRSVTITGGYIPRGAFSNCSMLTEVTLGDGVTSIGNGAFDSCSGLTNITIPDGVPSIGDFAFDNCSSLTSITIPNSVTSIGDYAFYNCSSLTSITIPDSVTSIGEGAFGHCSSLTSITIPDSVTSIGERAFFSCSSLPSITIGNSVTSIGYRTFYYCSNLTSVTIGNSVTSIGDSAFYYCSSITSVTIPESVTSIGDDAFYYCSSLTSVTIGNGVTNIDEWTFGHCSSLTSVTIPDSVTSIGDYAFYDCSSLTKMICCPTTPPTISSHTISSATTKIIVTEQSETAYKTALNWSSYADKIVGKDNNYFNFVGYSQVIKNKTKTINGNSIWGSGNLAVGGTEVTVDQHFDSSSTNPQSGTAVAEAIYDLPNVTAKVQGTDLQITTGGQVTGLVVPNTTTAGKLLTSTSVAGVGAWANNLPILTEAPTEDNTNGIIIVVLDHDPTTKYNGYLYLITEE